MTVNSNRYKLPVVFLPSAALLSGLAVAQIIATFQVYRSDENLYAKLTAVIDAGYLAVPNVNVMPSLETLEPAVCGGIFFTLTVGCGIALLSLVAAWTWDRLFARNRAVLYGLLSAWAGCLIFANVGALDPWLSAYLLFEPPVVFSLAIRRLAGARRQASLKTQLVHVLAFVVLALLWAGQINSELFIDLRDSLLWSNSFGRKVNDFYYAYTLYPAEAFKSLDQKLLKTYSLEVPRSAGLGSLIRTLVNYDYLKVADARRVDIEITGTADKLIFMQHGDIAFRTTIADAADHPQAVVAELSDACDGHARLRQVTFLSLLFAFPAALYIVLHGLIAAAAYPFVKAATAAKIASIGCLLIGAGIFVPFQFSRSSVIGVKEIPAALHSQRWQERVAALRVIQQRGLDVAQYPAYDALGRSPLLAERYWFVRSLAFSRGLKSQADLLRFLDDPELNVRTMAMYALGQRGIRTAVPELLKHLKSSRIWYDQLYAYQALRKLGWKQATLDSAP
jgi:hypothetical protein